MTLIHASFLLSVSCQFCYFQKSFERCRKKVIHKRVFFSPHSSWIPEFFFFCYLLFFLLNFIKGKATEQEIFLKRTNFFFIIFLSLADILKKMFSGSFRILEYVVKIFIPIGNIGSYYIHNLVCTFICLSVCDYFPCDRNCNPLILSCYLKNEFKISGGFVI